MTRAEKLDCLSRYRDLQRNIELCNELAQKEIDSAEQLKTLAAGSPVPWDISHLLTLYDSAASHYMEEAERYCQQCRQIVAAIDSVSDATQHMVLSLRFLQGLSSTQVGKILTYDTRHIFRLSQKAIDSISEDYFSST